MIEIIEKMIESSDDHRQTQTQLDHRLSHKIVARC